MRIGLHPRALAGGEDDGGERAGGGDLGHGGADATPRLLIPAPAVIRPAMTALRFKTIVFDLDGTLADTAPDLTAALNHALGEMGRPPVPAEDVRHMVGHGAKALLRKGLAATGDVSEALVDEGFPIFLAHYEAHIADLTRPFPGVEQALDALAADGVALAICTNKLEALTHSFIAAIGWQGRFAAIVGGDTPAGAQARSRAAARSDRARGRRPGGVRRRFDHRYGYGEGGGRAVRRAQLRLRGPARGRARRGPRDRSLGRADRDAGGDVGARDPPLQGEGDRRRSRWWRGGGWAIRI